MTGLLTRPVTILTAGETTDSYGNTVTDWTSPERVTVNGYVEQRARGENTDGRTLEEQTWLLVVPAETALTEHSRIVVDGDVFETVGPPHEVWNPRLRRTAHLEATLVRTAG